MFIYSNFVVIVPAPHNNPNNENRAPMQQPANGKTAWSNSPRIRRGRGLYAALHSTRCYVKRAPGTEVLGGVRMIRTSLHAVHKLKLRNPKPQTRRRREEKRKRRKEEKQRGEEEGPADRGTARCTHLGTCVTDTLFTAPGRRGEEKKRTREEEREEEKRCKRSFHHTWSQ